MNFFDIYDGRSFEIYGMYGDMYDWNVVFEGQGVAELHQYGEVRQTFHIQSFIDMFQKRSAVVYRNKHLAVGLPMFSISDGEYAKMSVSYILLDSAFFYMLQCINIVLVVLGVVENWPR